MVSIHCVAVAGSTHSCVCPPPPPKKTQKHKHETRVGSGRQHEGWAPFPPSACRAAAAGVAAPPGGCPSALLADHQPPWQLPPAPKTQTHTCKRGGRALRKSSSMGALGAWLRLSVHHPHSLLEAIGMRKNAFANLGAGLPVALVLHRAQEQPPGSAAGDSRDSRGARGHARGRRWATTRHLCRWR